MSKTYHGSFGLNKKSQKLKMTNIGFNSRKSGTVFRKSKSVFHKTGKRMGKEKLAKAKGEFVSLSLKRHEAKVCKQNQEKKQTAIHVSVTNSLFFQNLEYLKNQKAIQLKKRQKFINLRNAILRQKMRDKIEQEGNEEEEYDSEEEEMEFSNSDPDSLNFRGKDSSQGKIRRLIIKDKGNIDEGSNEKTQEGELLQVAFQTKGTFFSLKERQVPIQCLTYLVIP